MVRTYILSFRYSAINPAKFALGDIVECQASFRLFKISREKKYKMSLILRSLVLEDNQFTKVKLIKKNRRTQRFHYISYRWHFQLKCNHNWERSSPRSFLGWYVILMKKRMKKVKKSK